MGKEIRAKKMESYDIQQKELLAEKTRIEVEELRRRVRAGEHLGYCDDVQ